MLQETQSGISGLSTVQAAERLRRYGRNHIQTARVESVFSLLLRQIKNPLIYVLLASVAITAFLGKFTDSSVILAVIAINALLGFIQEYKASRAIAALSAMAPESCMVMRDGKWRSLRTEMLVPGDRVLLQAGDKVPADTRLVFVKNLQINESALTGESLPVSKQTQPVENQAALGDRVCMAYGGTLVSTGTGEGVVVATGMNTELGRVSELLEQTLSLETPLTLALGRLANAIMYAILGVGLLLLMLGVFRGYGFADALLAAISLAVAATPEVLPAIVTITAAVGVRRMARRGAIIRHLPSVETLGSTTVICSDKTGTLTCNQMMVQTLWTPQGVFSFTGTGYSPEGTITKAGSNAESDLALERALTHAVLCSDATLQLTAGQWSVSGDPTEGALVAAARKKRINETQARNLQPRLDIIPFDSDRKVMATLHQTADNLRFVCLKGSPEAVLSRCVSLSNGGGLNVEQMQKIVREMASEGLRVLAIASKTVPISQDKLDLAKIESGFSLEALAGMIDPPRPEARRAIAACKDAGISVKMITGDHPVTAHAIGVQLDLCEKNAPVLTGNELDSISKESELFREQSLRTSVFARVTPEHKLKLVGSLQQSGQVVAMTGDGVNDAPALKRADIGVAMGITGTAVSKEAADVILTDDNFATIVAAVEEGRRVYDNLVKAIAFLLPTNLGQALIILLAVFFFPIEDGHLLMPIRPVQILWVNLVVAIFLSMPLAFESFEPNIMRRRPRKPNTPILSGFIVMRCFLVGALMAIAGVGLFAWKHELDLARGVDPERALCEAQTMAVTSIMFFQSFYLLNCRSLTDSIFKIGFFTNRYVFVGIGVTLLMQVAYTHLPVMNSWFHTAPLELREWLLCGAVGLIGIPLITLEKKFWKVRQDNSTL